MSGFYANVPGYGGANWQNPVVSAVDLPTIGNLQGDMRVALDTGVVYHWYGDAWVVVPTGVTSNINLAEVGGASISLGQALMAGSIPVVIASNQSPINVAGIVAGDFTPQGLTVEGIITMMTIDETMWYLAPPSPLALRNNIVIQNLSTNGSIMYWNYSASAPSSAGFQVPQNGSRSVSIRGSIPVYIRMASGSGSTSVCVEELE